MYTFFNSFRYRKICRAVRAFDHLPLVNHSLAPVHRLTEMFLEFFSERIQPTFKKNVYQKDNEKDYKKFLHTYFCPDSSIAAFRRMAFSYSGSILIVLSRAFLAVFKSLRS